MNAFMLVYRPTHPKPSAPPVLQETARRLQDALAAHGIHTDLTDDQRRVLVSVCHGLVAMVQEDGIWWHSPRELRPGIPLYVHRGTVAGAAEALVDDHALLTPVQIAEEPHDATPV
ncbi:hypothetical protein [Spongiactinospora rosea]|nr:hypothetical protein [Spongiactinospora rosea]